MEIQQKAVLNGLTAMQRFLNQHSRTMAPLNQSPVRAALDELLRGVAAQEATKHAAKLRQPSRLERLSELRATFLSAHVRPIVRLGRKRAAKAPMLDCLRNPACDSTSDDLVSAAAEIGTIVGPHREIFLSEGFPDDFLDQMAAAGEAVLTATSEYFACRWDIDGAVAEIKRLICRGRALARVLDTLALPLLEGNPKLAAEWRVTTSLRRRPESD
jgi:hypothetical protein